MCVLRVFYRDSVVCTRVAWVEHKNPLILSISGITSLNVLFMFVKSDYMRYCSLPVSYQHGFPAIRTATHWIFVGFSPFCVNS